MRRMALGFLVLAVVVLGGIVLIEKTSGTAPRANALSSGNRALALFGGDGSAPSAPPIHRPPPGGPHEPHEPDASDGDAQGFESVDGPVPLKPVAQAPAKEFSYTVVGGDNLASIATRFLGSPAPEVVERIRKRNGMKAAKDLRIGDKLVIEVARYETWVADGTKTLRDVATRFYGKPDRTAPLFNANPSLPKKVDAKVRVGTLIYIPR